MESEFYCLIEFLTKTCYQKYSSLIPWSQFYAHKVQFDLFILTGFCTSCLMLSKTEIL